MARDIKLNVFQHSASRLESRILRMSAYVAALPEVPTTAQSDRPATSTTAVPADSVGAVGAKRRRAPTVVIAAAAEVDVVSAQANEAPRARGDASRSQPQPLPATAKRPSEKRSKLTPAVDASAPPKAAPAAQAGPPTSSAIGADIIDTTPAERAAADAVRARGTAGVVEKKHGSRPTSRGK